MPGPIVWRKAISQIDAAIKVTECGNRRYTVREIPSKRRARVAINLPNRSTVAITNVSGVARHTNGGVTLYTLQVAAITESNTYERREIEKNWLIPLARESLNYYRGSELYIFPYVRTHTCAQVHDQVRVYRIERILSFELCTRIFRWIWNKVFSFIKF